MEPPPDKAANPGDDWKRRKGFRMVFRDPRKRPEAIPMPTTEGKPNPAAQAARQVTREARKFLREVNYPHKIHPALVPGVSIDDQRVRYTIDRWIVGGVGVAILGFVLWGVLDPAGVGDSAQEALNWTTQNLGWIFNTLAAGMVVFLLYLAFSRFGRIPLGLEGSKPEYSTLSWAAMLFAAGIGIAIIFFGPYEPLSHYFSPPPGAYDAASVEAVKGALVQSAFHWGINAWAMYAVVGLAVAYASYRRGRVPLMSAILAPLMKSYRSDSVSSRFIDALAIIATLFGTAASLGLGALQIARGLAIVSGWQLAGVGAALVIIGILTVGTIASAVSGVARGIKWLSNINLVLAIGLALFIFIVGPTVFLINIIPGVIIDYAASIPALSARTMSDSEAMRGYLTGWTTFYWAWWVSWAPFVGIFTAKISQGRTIRQFVLGVLFLPMTIIVVAFTIMGGTAIWLQRDRGAMSADNTAGGMPPAEDTFFTMLGELPLSGVVAPVIMVMLAIFFITTADSASLVNSQLAQGGNPEPRRWVTAFFAALMAGIAVVMLLMGGATALSGLQNLVTVTALPFSVILVAMAVALWKDLRSDPMFIRAKYERWAVQKAVRRGIDEHGDNFTLAIEPTTEETYDYGAWSHFESDADEYTAWYQQTDEDGLPIEDRAREE